MIIKLLTEHHLECLSLRGSCTGTHVKMSHCLKSCRGSGILTGPYWARKIFILHTKLSRGSRWQEFVNVPGMALGVKGEGKNN